MNAIYQLRNVTAVWFLQYIGIIALKIGWNYLLIHTRMKELYTIRIIHPAKIKIRLRFQNIFYTCNFYDYTKWLQYNFEIVSSSGGLVLRCILSFLLLIDVALEQNYVRDILKLLHAQKVRSRYIFLWKWYIVLNTINVLLTFQWKNKSATNLAFDALIICVCL